MDEPNSMMDKTIYIVIMYGGEYEDAWEANIRAFSERGDADNLIADYKRWAEQLGALEPDTDDPDDIQSFWNKKYEELEIPADDVAWVRELVDDADIGMTIEELGFVK